MAVVYTGGTFDVPHVGHVNFLRQCKRIAGDDGKVVVSLNTDAFIAKFKVNKPLFSFKERKALLNKIEYVDEVIANSGGADSKPTILKVKPDFIVIGSDWAKKNYYAQMQFTQEWLDAHNIGLIYVPYTEVISSSEIKRRGVRGDRPLVSVGLPTYNRAERLEKALQSLTKQAYEHLEILVSDNHSSDWTPLLLQHWSQKDRRIKVYTQTKKLPAIDNAHFVMGKAKGKYFFWASDDDLWERDYVSETVDYFEKKADDAVVLVSPKWQVVDQRGRVRYEVTHAFPGRFSGTVAWDDYLSEAFSGYKGNLYWGLYRRQPLRNMLSKTTFPAAAHNDVYTIHRILATHRIDLLPKRLFVKTEYFADARKEKYGWHHRITDTITGVIMPLRTVMNMLLPWRLAYVVKVVRGYYEYNRQLMADYERHSSRMAYLNVVSAIQLFFHLIPNDIDGYRQRNIIFAGRKLE